MSKLATLLNTAVRGGLEGVFVALPGKVVAYDKNTQRADVQPLIQRGYRGEDQKRAVKRLPVANDVPVMFLGGADGRITVPVKKGTRVLLIMCSSSIARWKSSDDEVDPGDDRRHALADAIAIVGLHAKPPTSAPTDAIVLHAGLGIKVKVGGDTGTEPTIMATTFMNLLRTLLLAIAGQIGSSGTPAGATAAAAQIVLLLNSPTFTGFFDSPAQSQMKTSKTEVK